MASGDYELRWPRDLFRSELSSLINNRHRLSDWDARVELLLEDVFTGPKPRDDFASSRAIEYGGPQSKPDFLVGLLRRADTLPENRARRPYWAERQLGVAPDQLSRLSVAREFVRLIEWLDASGYFEAEFEKDCVDDPSTTSPVEVIERLSGVQTSWLPAPADLAGNESTFFTMIEVLHDLVARPRNRSFHGYSGCGWHHSDFSYDSGRALYIWHVNQLLDRSDHNVRLATVGEDAGRLVVVGDAARQDLLDIMVERSDESTGGRVRHAVALFRGRASDENDKRSAVVALAGLLEERRQLLKTSVARRDEGALFQIANEFAVRHQNAAQKRDYDPIFLDWMFWWYLATIEMTDRIVGRDSGATDR